MVGHHLGWRWTRNPIFRVIHLVMILYVAYEAVVGIECPLTVWERDLRIEAGQIPANFAEQPGWTVDNASFVARLARGVLMCDSSWEPVLNASYYFFAGLVMATLFLSPPCFGWKGAAKPPTQPAFPPENSTGITSLDRA
jgi:hypothetical protein